MHAAINFDIAKIARPFRHRGRRRRSEWILKSFYEGVISAWHVARWVERVYVCVCVCARQWHATWHIRLFPFDNQPLSNQNRYLLALHLGESDTAAQYTVTLGFFVPATSVWCVKIEFSVFLSVPFSLPSAIRISCTSIVKCQTQLFKCSDKCSLSFFLSFNSVVPVGVNLHANL